MASKTLIPVEEDVALNVDRPEPDYVDGEIIERHLGATPHFEAQERILSSEVSDLELNYLSMSNKVDLALGHSLGFTEIKATFATRKSLGSLGFATPTKNDL